MKRKKSSLGDNSLSDRIYRLCAYFLLALIMLVLIYPLWTVLVASFSDPKELYQKTFHLWPTKWTLDSYTLVFQDKDFLRGIWNSVQYTAVGTILNVFLNICAAYPLSKRNLKGSGMLMKMFTFTMFFSGGMIPTYLVVSQLHLIDSFWAMILPNAIGTFNVIIMRTYFQNSIPSELEDAASMDGCTNFRFLWSVVVPLSAPIIVVVAFYYGVARWNDYFSAMMYLNDSTMWPLQLVLREILIENQSNGMLRVATDAAYADRMMSRMGLKYAVIVISTVPIMVVYPFAQKFFSKGVMVGAVKG